MGAFPVPDIATEPRALKRQAPPVGCVVSATKQADAPAWCRRSARECQGTETRGCAGRSTRRREPVTRDDGPQIIQPPAELVDGPRPDATARVRWPRAQS